MMPPPPKKDKISFRSLLATNYIFHINLAMMECCVKSPYPKTWLYRWQTHHLALPNPPTLPFTSSVDQIWQTSQTDQLLHHLHTRPTVETVLGTVKQNAGGGRYKWGGAVQPFSSQGRGGEENNSKNKTHLSGQQDLHKCVCFRDCNGSLMRHEYSATYQNKKHLNSKCTRQPTVHQLAMLVHYLRKKKKKKELKIPTLRKKS